MKNNEFINHLPKDIFVISGSYGLKLHDKLFRDPSDIDICLIEGFIDYLQFRADKFGAKFELNGQYECETIQITFDDESKIDCIIYNTMPEKIKKEIEISGSERKEVYVLPVQEILRRKADLLAQYIGVDEEKFKKHCLDIGYFIAKGKTGLR